MSLSLAGNGTLTGVDLDALSATGRLPSGLLPVGSVLQVVSVAKTDHFSTTSTSFVDVTGLTASITPSSSANKVLVIVDVPLGNSTTDTQVTRMQLRRGSTDIYLGTAGTARNETGYMFGNAAEIQNSTKVFLDSPASAVSVTYVVRLAVTGGTGYVNRRNNADDGVVSSITLVEVAA